MESTLKTNQSEIYYAPCPYTERAFSSSMAVSPNGKWMAYCVGNVVALRSLEDFKTSKIYTGHKVKTSAVSFSTHNHFVASGDIQGNIKIFFIDDLSNKKEFNNVLGSKINGIEWNDESNKIFFYGEGKNALARCITWDTGNNLGDFSGISKVVLGGDMRKIRPYRAATGSEDFQVNFYEGTPFKLSKINKLHTNFVTGIRFSPDSTHFVSVGFDKRIVLYEGKTGIVVATIAEDKMEGNHTMAIIGVCWIDNLTFATCSLDRTVKVWDVTEKKLKYTLYPKDSSSLDIPDSGCAINTNGKHLISLALSGTFNIWEVSTLAEGKLPDKIIDGHQNYISGVVYNKTRNETYSSDISGKVLIWNGEDNTFLGRLNNFEKKVVSMNLSSDENSLYTIIFDGTVSNFNLESRREK
jgi:WD40 repeat protein